MTAALALLLACRPAIEVGGDSGSPDDSPWDGNTGPYLGQEEEPPDDVDTAALGAALDELLGQLMQIHARPVLDAYAALEPGADPDCPEWFDSDGVPYWYDACTDSRGIHYDGYAIAYEYDGYEAEDGNTYWGRQLWGVATITGADGRELEGRGGASLLSGTTADGAAFTYSMLESGWRDSAAVGTWLDSSIDPAFAIAAYWYEDPGAGATWTAGTLTGLSGADGAGPVEAVIFEQLGVYAELLGGCAQEPQATVSLLDTQGRWIDVVFDAADGADPDCDGCGSAWLDGIDVGQVCTDFSPLLDWDEAPDW